MAVIDGERASARRERLLGDTPGAFAQARFVRLSAMKARRVINLIRGRTTTDAMVALRFAPQAASQPIAKVLASAVANAENNDQLDPELLLVAQAIVDEGPTLKRIQPRAQGRAYRIRKRSCHITIVVESVQASGKDRKRVKTSAKKSAAKAPTATRSKSKAADAKVTQRKASKATAPAEKKGDK